MGKYYFKISWRKMVSNLPVSVTNILGLSVGFVAFLLILEYVAFENNYDRPNKNIDALYRITTDSYRGHKLVKHTAKTSSGIGKLMIDNIPEVVKQTRVLHSDGYSISYENRDFTKLTLMLVDSSFLPMFNIDLIEGDIHTALRDANSIVLTERLARNIFGDMDNYSTLLGKSIQLGRVFEKITGICKNPSESSSFQFDLLNSYNTLYSNYVDGTSEYEYGFTDLDYLNFVQLIPGADHKVTETKLKSLINERFKELAALGNENVFHLQPFNNMHFSVGLEDEVFKTSNKTTIWGLFAMGLFLLVIAWINYINIAVARSIERAKEVSLRKMSGATSYQLIRIFLAESFLVNFFALMVSIGGLLLIQNSFNGVIKHNLGLGVLFEQGSITLPVFFLGIFIVGILTSALYPAYILAKVNPVVGLKGKYSESVSVGFYRKMLVGIQLTITMALISASVIVYKQLNFVTKGDMGYNMSQMLVVSIPQCTYSEQNAFMDKLKQLSNVEAVAASFFVPGGELINKSGVKLGNSSLETGLMLQSNTISPGFIDTYKIKLNVGRDFSQIDGINASDSISNVIINEKSVGYLNLHSPAEAIGKSIYIEKKQCNIIGIVNDFHQKSYYYPIQPVILFPGKSTLWKFSIKLKSQNIPATLNTIKSEFKTFFSGKIFNYFFADDSFNSVYQSDMVFSDILKLFLLISIVLASISIFCISLFYSIKRRKELSIRKILGASIFRIIWYLLKDFIYLAAVAFIVSVCLTTILAYTWLNGFSYRINIGPGVFISTALSMFLLILVVTSFNTIKIAVGKPIKGIGTE